MRNLRLCFFLILTTVFGSDLSAQNGVEDDFYSMIDAIVKSDQIEIVVDVSMHFKNSKVEKSKQVRLLKNKSDFRLKNGDNEMVKIGENFFVIDHLGKCINYYHISEKSDIRKKEFDPQIEIMKMKSMLKDFDTVYLASTYDNVKTFVFKSQSREISTVYLAMDATSNLIKSVKYIYNEKFTDILSTVEIYYTKIDKNPKFSEGIWSLDRIVKLQGNRIIAVPPYINYRINIIQDVKEFIN